MGHQINFFLSPDDVLKLEKEITSLENTLILKDQSRGPFPAAAKSTELTENDRQWLFFYLVRERDLDYVVTEEVKTQGYWRIDDMFSPVVEFTRSNFDGEIFRRGRLYYNDAYYNGQGKLVSKTPSFCAWARKVISKARTNLIYDKNLLSYLGKEAIEMRDAGVRFQLF